MRSIPEVEYRIYKCELKRCPHAVNDQMPHWVLQMHGRDRELHTSWANALDAVRAWELTFKLY